MDFVPLDEVDHDIPCGGPLDLGVNVLPGQPGPDVGLDLRLARLVKVVAVLGRQRPEEVVRRRVVASVCGNQRHSEGLYPTYTIDTHIVINYKAVFGCHILWKPPYNCA